MATATEQALFGDPLGVISQSIGDMLMNPMGGVVNVVPGTTYQSMADWGKQHYQDFGQAEGRVVPDGGYAAYVQGSPDLAEEYETQREDMGSPGQLAPLTIGGWKRKALSVLNPELERQRNLLDKLVAGGDLTNPGYVSSIPNVGSNRLRNVPGHAFGADMYGYQAGLKAALATQMDSPLLYSLSQIGKDENPFLTDIKKSAAAKALEGYRSAEEEYGPSEALKLYRARQRRELQERLDKPWWGSKLMGRLNETFPVIDEPWWGGDLMDAGKNLVSSIIPPAGAAIAPADETDVRYIPGGKIVDNQLILNPIEELPPVETPEEWQARQESEARAAFEADRTATIEALLEGRGRTESGIGDRVYDGSIVPLTNAQAMTSEVQRALDRAGRIGPTPPVTALEAQLQAITELAQTDPTIAARYTTPGSQDLIDIATQVDSFAGMPTPPVPLPPQLARPAPTPEPTPEPARVKKPKKVKKAKTQAQTTKARRSKKVKDVKVKSVAKTSKVTKSAASQALSRARGNVKDANTIAKITKSFTAAKKKDPKVYMPTIRRAPSGAWVGGF